MNNGKNMIQEITPEQMAKVSGGTDNNERCPYCGMPYGQPGNHTCVNNNNNFFNILPGPVPEPQPAPGPVPVPIPEAES